MKKIEILHIAPLRGPNIWTYRPALEAWVDIGDLEDFPSNTLPGFVDRLMAWLPSLIEHKCSIGERGGFLQRLNEGTWAAHILEHVTLELQNLIGQRTSFGKARSTSKRGIYKVVVRSREESVTRACLEAARQLILAAIEDQPFDVAHTLAGLRALADRNCLGPSTASIVDAATERGIPSIRLTEGNLVQLGHGAYSRRIWTAETDSTSAIGESIASDKDLTKRLLAACGVPIPEGREVDDADDAWAAAEEIGLPVVVKPTDANHGRGVFTDLNTRAEVDKAYGAALGEGSGVMVERFVRGNAHRLLVVGGRVVAAIRGKTQTVVGDGRSTVAQLVETQINSDPRCGEEEEFPLEPLILADEPIALLELERQGLDAASVPPAGRQILVKRQGDLAYDETDEVHPEVARAATLAARVVGLDIAGIDLVAEDIGRPLADQRGAIVEVNAGPGLLMHLKPAEGKPRPVGAAIVRHLFPAGEDGRIPIVGITGCHGTTAVARLLGEMQRRGIATHLGHKLVGFEPDRVRTAGGEIKADLIVFMPGLTGNAWFDNTDLPRSPGGLLKADAQCRVEGCERIYVAGDAGSFPGPDWMPKQAHMADLQAEAAAENLLAELSGGKPAKTFRVELLCIVDSLDAGMLVKRTPAGGLALPPLGLMHNAKAIFESWYLRRYR